MFKNICFTILKIFNVFLYNHFVNYVSSFEISKFSGANTSGIDGKCFFTISSKREKLYKSTTDRYQILKICKIVLDLKITTYKIVE